MDFTCNKMIKNLLVALIGQAFQNHDNWNKEKLFSYIEHKFARSRRYEMENIFHSC